MEVTKVSRIFLNGPFRTSSWREESILINSTKRYYHFPILAGELDMGVRRLFSRGKQNFPGGAFKSEDYNEFK